MDYTLPYDVPAYTLEAFKPPAHPYALGIFVLNENGHIQAQLQRIAELGLASAVDIYIADGGSTDGALARPLLEKAGITALLTKTGPGGLSAQMRMFFAIALERGYAGCVCADGNNKDGMEAVPAFVNSLKEGIDFVQGSRYLPGGGHEHTPLLREWGVKCLHAPLISLAARFRYTDTTNGFRAYSRSLLSDPRVQPLRKVFDTYNLHYYLAVRAPRLGFAVKEIPVWRRYPPSGKTPTKIRGWNGYFVIMKLLMATVLGRYNP